MSNIAVVVPTIREENYREFVKKWDTLFRHHNITLITIKDGEDPELTCNKGLFTYSVRSIMGDDFDLIYNKNDGVRNLGFAFIAVELPRIEYIITLDDDCYPNDNDPIQEHIDALQMRVPTSWISTASHYMRGFPYAVRNENEVVLSHGVWENVKDWDAPTQLTRGNRDVTFYKGPIPKGIMYPMCIMNVAFKRKMLPFMYQAPMGEKIGLDRFADIWSGINAKREIDKQGWAAVTGYSTIYHSRASDVFTNLVKEAKGIGLNEEYWKDTKEIREHEYFQLYHEKMRRWQKFINKYVS